jgi:hypothetical protein
MRAAVALVLLSALASCASRSASPGIERPAQVGKLAEPDAIEAPPVVAPVRSWESARLTERVVGLVASDQIRACLEKGIDKRDLVYVGFDQVNIPECIDRVITAVVIAHERPGDPLVLEKLSDCVDLYLAARQEAEGRRVLISSCIPSMR